MDLRPLHDYVIIRRKEEEHLSSGGIVIPDTATEKPVQGEVVAVGKGKILKEGDVVVPDVKPGDNVYSACIQVRESSLMERNCS